LSAFHLKGLDTLRAIAAITVIIGHIELFKREHNFPCQIDVPSGHIGVVLFFVLSGFLITVLLLKEKKKQNTISLKNFYLRRILRVWPLYYLVLLISYLVSDFSPSTTSAVLCLSIFPNIAHAIGFGWVPSPQIWSIGVEEQFYAVWPFAIKNTSKLLYKLFTAFVLLTLLPHGILFILARVYPDPNLMLIVNRIALVTQFQCLVLGGIVGVLFSNENFRRRFHPNKWLSWIFIFLPFILWFFGFNISRFQDEVYAVFFGVTILLITTVNQNSVRDIGVFKYLGKISYGLYMYHWIVLLLIFKIDLPSGMNPILQNIVLYSAVLGLTVIISSISFFKYENWFLKLKQRYNRV